MPDYEVREFSIPVATTEGATPLPSGWQAIFAERRADYLVLLLQREAGITPLEAEQAKTE